MGSRGQSVSLEREAITAEVLGGGRRLEWDVMVGGGS